MFPAHLRQVMECLLDLAIVLRVYLDSNVQFHHKLDYPASTQEYQDLLTKYQYDKTLEKELEQEVQSAHCDMLPEKMLSPMLLGQQTRDLAMTQAIQSTLLKNNTATKAQIVLQIDYSLNNSIGYTHQKTLTKTEQNPKI